MAACSTGNPATHSGSVMTTAQPIVWTAYTLFELPESPRGGGGGPRGRECKCGKRRVVLDRRSEVGSGIADLRSLFFSGDQQFKLDDITDSQYNTNTVLNVTSDIQIGWLLWE